MALAPTDFYAYSRATGVPVPEDPEERAALAPEVLEFRRNQLRGPEQESNLPGILGAAALGVGSLVGGALLARRLGFGKAKVPVSKEPVLTQKGIQDVTTIGRQQAAEQTVRQLRQERPTGIIQTDLSAINKLLEDPELKQLVQTQSAEEQAELRSEMARQQARVQVQKREDLWSLVKEIQEEAPVTNQTIGALESGEDQMTGRIMRGVQRNEDLDSSQVNQVARETGDAKVAASLTPDGVPKDQTNIWGKPTIPVATKKNQQYGPQPIRLLPAATQGRQQQAQSYLSKKREELSTRFGPTRTERILSENPELIEAAELYATTGDPNVLSRFSTTPSTPVTVKPNVQMRINDEELPTGQFYQKTGYPENTGDLLEQDIELTNKISSIGLQQQQLTEKAKELGEQELMLRVAMDRDPEGGGAYTKMFGQVKYQQQNLPKPESLNVDLGDALEERDFLRRYMDSLKSLGSTYKLGDFQEGVRSLYEYDSQGNIIPQTLELRGGRRSVDLDPKTGGGRLVAEYDPEGQTGSTRGVYGVEQTSRRSGESTRPTQMTMNELVREGLEQAAASPEGDVPIPPSLMQMTEQRPTAAARRSIDASQIIRQAIIEGRDPQIALRQRGFNV